MSENTSIEWTHIPGYVPRTWNPTTGCNKVSQGCKFCYAEVMHRRLRGMKQEKYSRPFLDGAFPWEPAIKEPFAWKKPSAVFVDSMSDLFHENISFDFIDKVFTTMALTPQHIYIILTKRSDRMREYMANRFDISNIEDIAQNVINEQFNVTRKPLPAPWFEDNYGKDADGLHQGFKWIYDDPNFDYLPNVWLGVSVENESQISRIDDLVKTPAAIRFLSCEPLLGSLEIIQYMANDEIHWVIAGGESGHGARPPHPNWFRYLRAQCAACDVPFFFKQWGEYQFGSGTGKNITILHDGDWCLSGWEHSLRGRNDKVMSAEEWKAFNPTVMCKVGKHAAGALLDGVEHKAFPNIVKQ